MTAKSSLVTRNDTEVWLLEQPIAIIGGRKLPSKGDVLHRLSYMIQNDSKTVRTALF